MGFFEQTFAVLVNNFLIFGGAAAVTFIVLVSFAFTSYWWITALYVMWYLYDLGSDEDGGWDYRQVSLHSNMSIGYYEPFLPQVLSFSPKLVVV